MGDPKSVGPILNLLSFSGCSRCDIVNNSLNTAMIHLDQTLVIFVVGHICSINRRIGGKALAARPLLPNQLETFLQSISKPSPVQQKKSPESVRLNGMQECDKETTRIKQTQVYTTKPV